MAQLAAGGALTFEPDIDEESLLPGVGLAAQVEVPELADQAVPAE